MNWCRRLIAKNWSWLSVSIILETLILFRWFAFDVVFESSSPFRKKNSHRIHEKMKTKPKDTRKCCSIPVYYFAKNLRIIALKKKILTECICHEFVSFFLFNYKFLALRLLCTNNNQIMITQQNGELITNSKMV